MVIHATHFNDRSPTICGFVFRMPKIHKQTSLQMKSSCFIFPNENDLYSKSAAVANAQNFFAGDDDDEYQTKHDSSLANVQMV